MTGLFNKAGNMRVAAVRRPALIAFMVALTIFGLYGVARIRINCSPSLPPGLYLASSDPEDTLIEFCPAAPFANLAVARGYRDRGSCQDGAMPLMKPIVARAGDIVTVLDEGIVVNGRLIENTAPLKTDTHGRPLKPWPSGQYRVGPDAVWVVSSHNPRSFDSRYFGPVPTSAIRNHVRPLMTAW